MNRSLHLLCGLGVLTLLLSLERVGEAQSLRFKSPSPAPSTTPPGSTTKNAPPRAWHATGQGASSPAAGSPIGADVSNAAAASKPTEGELPPGAAASELKWRQLPNAKMPPTVEPKLSPAADDGVQPIAAELPTGNDSVQPVAHQAIVPAKKPARPGEGTSNVVNVQALVPFEEDSVSQELSAPELRPQATQPIDEGAGDDAEAGAAASEMVGEEPIFEDEYYPESNDWNDAPWIRNYRSRGFLTGMREPGQDPYYYWVRAEFVLGWTRGMALPPLASTTPTSVPLFGGNNYNNTSRPGGRIVFGTWLDPQRLLGIEGEYFALGDQSTRYQASGVNGVPTIVRPFFDADPSVNAPRGENVSVVNSVSGTITIDAVTRFQSAGVRAKVNFGCEHGCVDPCNLCAPRHPYTNWAFLIGYRFLRQNDALNIREDLVSVPPATDQFVVQDSFGTGNYFHGGDVGILMENRMGPYLLEMQGRLAVGNTRKVINIDGSTDFIVAPPQPGGLLAQTTNIGTYRRDDFTAIPEVQLNLGYQLTPLSRVYLGYTFLYWPQVVRAGDQVDLRVDSRLIPTSPPSTPPAGIRRPQADFHLTNFWVQGITTGLDWRW